MTTEPITDVSIVAVRHKSAARTAPDALANIVRMDKSLRPLVPRMTKLVESYVDFLRWALRDRSLDALCATVRDLRSLAQLFGLAAVVEVCARLERAALAQLDNEARRCIDELATLVQDAVFVYS
jgi:hypothetical protein